MNKQLNLFKKTNFQKIQKNNSRKNNFLNAQNYILWKTEKKKLLSKFFVWNFLDNFFTFINKLDYFLYKNGSNLLMILIILFSFIFFLKFKIWLELNFFNIKYIFYILLFSSFFLTINISLLKVPKKHKFRINNFKEYFLLYDKKNNNFIKKIRFSSLLLFPIIFIFWLYKIISSIIYVFLIKWTNEYIILKYKPNINLLKAFIAVNINYWINEEFEIKIKEKKYIHKYPN